VIAALLLRAFGVQPDQSPPAEHWTCPTCGHPHVVGYARLGRVRPADELLREQYLDGAMDTKTFVALVSR
jgi:hypothetical protein